MRIADIPFVFMSYDEPWADRFWKNLKKKAPIAKRVHGVRGLDACHKAAAKAAADRHFISVDADTLVDAEFFDEDIPDEYLSDNCRIEWPCRNVTNGLIYGNGSLKCWPSALATKMKTHEAAPKSIVSVDHDFSTGDHNRKSAHRLYLSDVFSRTFTAEAPYHAFRCGFREGVRLSILKNPLLSQRDFNDQIDPRGHQLLKTWCSFGTHSTNGLWMIYGARLGLWMHRCTDWNYASINDYRWFEAFWNDIIATRFTPGGSICNCTGLRWNRQKLETEVVALRERIFDQLNFEVLDLSEEKSAYMVQNSSEFRAFSMVDSLGTMYLKGRGLPRDPKKALEMFEIGAILNVPAAVNNLARMHHLGDGVPVDPEAATSYYESAIELGNAYAPFHLAKLLQEQHPETPDIMARCDALMRLSAQRGFAPDPAPAQTASNA